MTNSMKITTIYKVHNISSAHKLNLPYESKCNNLHGHNYKVEIWVTGALDAFGMVVDFHKIKRVVNTLDHINLDDVFTVPSTAENIAIYLAEEIVKLAPDGITRVSVRVWETPSAYAEFLLENNS